MKLSDGFAGLLGLAQNVLGFILAVLGILFGLNLVDELSPGALPAVGQFFGRLVQLSSDKYVAGFMRDRVVLFAVIGVAFVFWVTHKWPTLIKTIGQALNPFARVGVATVSAIAAVLVALILAGPLGQARAKGECVSTFHLTLNHALSLASDTTCGEGQNGRTASH
ncbi:hypothetical protein ACWD5R_20375 [Streptomyces sp. NPDC002514]|uniref:hypothetical protein n=1 Tax=Streptomyces sp. NPDC001270 TaxID=3364554 RepID=UPI0036CADE8D